jgi:hypothetical protein
MGFLNKEYNNVQVSSILRSNGYKFQHMGLGKYPIDYITMDREIYVLVKSISHGTSLFLADTKLDYIGNNKKRTDIIDTLFPMVNGKPDWDNKLVINYK